MSEIQYQFLVFPDCFLYFPFDVRLQAIQYSSLIQTVPYAFQTVQLVGGFSLAKFAQTQRETASA